MTRGKRLAIILSVVILVLAGVGYVFYSNTLAVATEDSDTAEVQTTTVRRGDITVSATGAGTIIPAREINLSFTTSGTLNELLINVGDKVAILGSDLATNLFGETDPIGQSLIVGTTRLTVIGVAAAKGVVGNTDFDAQLYTPITLVFDKFLPSQFAQFAGDRVRVIYAQIDEGANMDDVILQIQLKLASSKGITPEELPLTMQTQQDIINTQGAATEAFRNLLAWVAGVSLIVGGIGIMNIMLVSVTERTREIGIRQSVGATPGDIRLQFLAEALMLSLVGGLIGIAAGVGGSWLFGQTSDMRTVIVPSSILLAFGSAALVGIFFGFFPANKAAQLDPIEALRHE